jgi:hypothetical protein
MRKVLLVVWALCLSLALWGCDGDDTLSFVTHDAGTHQPDATAPAGKTFGISGTLSGLAGTGLTLSNGNETLPLTANGTFTFKTRLPTDATYGVTVSAGPTKPTQTCVIAGGSGTITTNVTNVVVTCTTNKYTVAGVVTGMAGTGLVLEDNSGDALSPGMDGAFKFATPLLSGSAFSVTVTTQPTSPTQTCVVSGGAGTLGSGDVTTVVVNCATGVFVVGGQVAGLDGTVVLQDNGGGNLPVNANGTFAFAAPVASGAPYAVTVFTQPSSPSQTCTVTSGSGAVTNANVTSVRIACTTNRFNVGGAVTGLAGTGLVLEDNLGSDLPVSASGSFAFGAPVTSGAPYAVTVVGQPTTPNQTCTVTGTTGTGTVGGADVASVAVACVTNTYPVGGTVIGLVGSGLVLEETVGGTSVAVAADGTFAFSAPVASGASYAVSVLTQPSVPTQTCSVSGGTGAVVAAAVVSITVNCSTNIYTIGGTVAGLAGTAVLQDNGGDSLSLTANGTFAFATPLLSGMAYAVTVSTQPGTPSQSCTLANTSGTVGGADVTGVTVTCTTNPFTIGGSVTGLSGAGLVLEDNLGDDLPVGANGSFTFATSVHSGSAYAVTVKSPPAVPSQTCSLTGASGTVGAANVTGVAVTCTTNRYAVGGTVTGLAGAGLVLQDNAGDNLPVSANGTFTFVASVASGSVYAVSAFSQPTSLSQTCAVTAAGGVVGGSDVTGVIVLCTTNSYAVGGTVTGLLGTGLVLEDNLGDDLPVSASGAFTFVTPVASGAAYSVTVLGEPAGPTQTCKVSAPSGNVGGGNVSVAVNCSTNAFTIGGTITGLVGTVVLQESGGDDDLTLSANGDFAFGTPVASGGTYAVTALTQPGSPSQLCTVTGGSGNVVATAVSDVAVTCVTNRFTIGGTVAGLLGTSLVLRDNGTDDLTLNANGTFTFVTSVPSGSPYAVTVQTQPGSPAQSCGVTSGGGTVAAANVAGVLVTCSPPQIAYTTPGSYTWVAPPGVTAVSVVLVGGGGGGTCDYYPGGGGGALAYGNNIAVVPGTSYSLYVGLGGSGGWQDSVQTIGGPGDAESDPPGFQGQPGEKSWFISETTIYAEGGAPGSASTSSGIRRPRSAAPQSPAVETAGSRLTTMAIRPVGPAEEASASSAGRPVVRARWPLSTAPAAAPGDTARPAATRRSARASISPVRVGLEARPVLPAIRQSAESVVDSGAAAAPVPTEVARPPPIRAPEATAAAARCASSGVRIAPSRTRTHRTCRRGWDRGHAPKYAPEHMRRAAVKGGGDSLLCECRCGARSLRPWWGSSSCSRPLRHARTGSPWIGSIRRSRAASGSRSIRWTCAATCAPRSVSWATGRIGPWSRTTQPAASSTRSSAIRSSSTRRAPSSCGTGSASASTFPSRSSSTTARGRRDREPRRPRPTRRRSAISASGSTCASSANTAVPSRARSAPISTFRRATPRRTRATATCASRRTCSSPAISGPSCTPRRWASRCAGSTPPSRTSMSAASSISAALLVCAWRRSASSSGPRSTAARSSRTARS